MIGEVLHASPERKLQVCKTTRKIQLWRFFKKLLGPFFIIKIIKINHSEQDAFRKKFLNYGFKNSENTFILLWGLPFSTFFLFMSSVGCAEIVSSAWQMWKHLHYAMQHNSENALRFKNQTFCITTLSSQNKQKNITY